PQLIGVPLSRTNAVACERLCPMVGAWARKFRDSPRRNHRRKHVGKKWKEKICVKRNESGPGSVYVACSSAPWRSEGYSWAPSQRLHRVVFRSKPADRLCVQPTMSGYPSQTTSGTSAVILSPSA